MAVYCQYAAALPYFFWLTAYMGMGSIWAQPSSHRLSSASSPRSSPRVITWVNAPAGHCSDIWYMNVNPPSPDPIFLQCLCIDDSFDPSMVVRGTSTILLRYICQGIKCHIFPIRNPFLIMLIQRTENFLVVLGSRYVQYYHIQKQ